LINKKGYGLHGKGTWKQGICQILTLYSFNNNLKKLLIIISQFFWFVLSWESV